MDFEHQKATTETYREQWERVFQRPQPRGEFEWHLQQRPQPIICPICGCMNGVHSDVCSHKKPVVTTVTYINGCPILEDK